MKSKRQKNSFNKQLTVVSLLGLTFIILGAAGLNVSVTASQKMENPVITANFTGRELVPTDTIELQLNRPLTADEGQLAFLLNHTDLTTFFISESNKYSYLPKTFPLPPGDNKLTVYLVNPAGEWGLLKEFPLLVAAKKVEPPNVVAPTAREGSKTEIEFTPNLSLNFKGESNVGFFPSFSRPSRLAFLDTGVQSNVQISFKRNGWTIGSQFSLAGSSFQPEALRFGELGTKAPQIDLASYLMQIEKGRFKFQLGHVFFGSQRHLINNFASRGLVLTVPVGRQNEISVTAMNGTSIVGFDNFIGVTRANHQVLGVTFAREFIKERPGGLRLELTAMRGSLLPLNGFNERTVNDAEKSAGGTIRLFFKDKSERLRFEGSFTRSQFRNPGDPFLAQGQNVTAIPPITRNARFIEVGFDFLRGTKVLKDKSLSLTGTFRHEEIEPLFRSIVAFNQADRRQNQFEVRGNLGEINFTFGNLRDRDNLLNIPSLLETLNHRNNLVVSVPLNSLMRPSKPYKWLPRLGYTIDLVHQFGAFTPVNGEFRDASQVPDQFTYLHNFNAEWSLTDTLRLGYRFSRSFQDNRQPGREQSDFRHLSNGVNLGYSGIKNVDLNLDLSYESAANLEQPRTDNTFRIGTNISWRNALIKNLTFNTNFSTILAGDRSQTFDSQNFEYDAQLAYNFNFGQAKFRKMSAQIFVRYFNRYGSRIDRLFFLNNFNKRQGFNMGLNFSFF